MMYKEKLTLKQILYSIQCEECKNRIIETVDGKYVCSYCGLEYNIYQLYDLYDIQSNDKLMYF